MFIVAGMLLFIPLAIGVQMLRIHWGAGDGLRTLWQNQALEEQEIPAQRGNIYDRNGRLLATNTVVYKAAIDPGFSGYDAALGDTVAKILGDISGKKAGFYTQKMQQAAAKGSRYVVLEKKIPHSGYLALKALDRRAVILEKQYTRVYTFKQLAAHVLGYVNYNMDGMIGLESKFNTQLKGKNGIQQVRRDRNNQTFAFVGAPRQLPENGQHLHTTIDIDIQAIAETELQAGVDRTKARAGVAIVMDVKSGAVRAMASWPTFDPNKPATMSEENRRNYAISDMMEPGSTFKLVTAVAALDQNVVQKDERFETPESGRKMIHGLAMVDHDPLGTLRFDEVFAKSSNIATSEIASRISPTQFYQYARNLGFGMLTDIELPGETAGVLKKPLEWTQVTQPFMSIGYEVLVTPLQVAQAYAAFANGGKLMKPHILEQITDENGDLVYEPEVLRVRQAIDEEVVEQLKPIFAQVVSDSGTASWAEIEGLSIAGKTGTAKMVKNGRYTTAYRASFAGFFPVEQPEYVCYVMLEEPRTSIYGGYAAGPIFRRITERLAAHEGYKNGWMKPQALEQLAQAPIRPLPSLAGFSAQEVEALADTYGLSVEYASDTKGYSLLSSDQLAEADSIEVSDRINMDFVSSKMDGELIEVPELRGLSMRQAARILQSAGLGVQMERSGTVYRQFPLPGEKMRSGRAVRVYGKARAMSQLAGGAS